MSVCQVGDAPQKKEERRSHCAVPDSEPAVSLGLLMLFVAAAIRGGVRVSRSSSS